ncbi:sulfate permease [Enterobacter cloacae]|uniref:Sulfate permease n=1 Tax=Enterobacter cloacae TaxID=550 RepID=A0A377M8S2_ENTCL|nr:sulfate permease [Enterobacter cloacae]
MAALVAVMIMVSIGTFSWRSVADLKSHPISTSVVMLATVVVVVATHNLAFGVLTGVLIASLNFATKVARFLVVSSELKKDTRFYKVTGQVFLPPPTALWRILIFAKR